MSCPSKSQNLRFKLNALAMLVFTSRNGEARYAARRHAVRLDADGQARAGANTLVWCFSVRSLPTAPHTFGEVLSGVVSLFRGITQAAGSQRFRKFSSRSPEQKPPLVRHHVPLSAKFSYFSAAVPSILPDLDWFHENFRDFIIHVTLVISRDHVLLSWFGLKTCKSQVQPSALGHSDKSFTRS